MEERINYTIVGAFVVILTIALLGIGYWLSNARYNTAHTDYVVYMKEAVAGLNVMAPVKYNGVSVGFVKAMQIDNSNPQFVKLILSIQEGTPITQSTVASLLPQGITGMTYVGLKNTKRNAPLLKRKPGEHYPVIPSEPSLFVYFGDALLSAANNLNNMSQRIDKLVNEKTINSTTLLLNNAALASEQLPALVEKMRKTLDTVNIMSTQLGTAGSKADVALQNVSQQAFPVAVRTLQNLEQVSQNLQKITSDVQRNPSVILRGKQHRLGPGERE